jgi:hypothetical protein
VTKLAKRDLLVPALLLLLSAVPMVGGVVRLTSLSGPATSENVRFVAAPAPILLHIGTAAVYCLVGAFQFSSGIRRRWPRWHRRAGRVLVPCGLVAALSGVWMTGFYPIPRGLQGPLLYSVRMIVGVAMAAALLIALSAIRRHDFARHEAWMIRAYALGQGAGAQVVVLGPWMAVSGEGMGLTRDLLMTLAWAINVGVGEWSIRRSRSSRGREPAARLSISGA